MSRADVARRAQVAFETDRLVSQRPGERPRGPLDPHDPRGPHFWPCPAQLGRRHDISMKRTDGVFGCWYCTKTKQQLLDARAAETEHASR